ncbi:MAG: Mrp/NBP35 family ATP-binding protein [Thermoanaerobaculum sp.]|nr:Mrp/NBP35 family ATP-binding protein [Thermoanaerobaculum sp.]MCX7894721.1 Mrp/NBP35 family ATP-binding protein [Thermoanaerobaculum sp.]MDW7966914.1 Mrp/NBP35 family ATP-binding protein [Thermoanaerobaculum sp.]
MVTEQQVLDALRAVKFPGLTRDIVSFGFVKAVRVKGELVEVDIRLTTANPQVGPQVEREARAALAQLPGVGEVKLSVTVETPGKAPAAPQVLPGVRFKVAVASGKGGVGKSTVAANLALALRQLNLTVGMLDADVYGPSQHLMLGCTEPPRVNEEEKILPVDGNGIKVMSLGFLVEPDTPVIWRGPMVMKALQQFLEDVAWGELDVLVVDLPPGTGDAQLTITQQVPLDGAIIVTTPQDVALIDARKGLLMFQRVQVPVLGVVENMSAFACPHCGYRTEIFKSGGGRRTAEALGVPFLGEIPIDPEVVVTGDAGRPIVAARPTSPAAQAFVRLARAVVEGLGGKIRS